MRRENINKGWKFFKDATSIEDMASCTSIGVNIPHTWNNLDGQDGGGDYYRGKCCYEKVVDVNKRNNKDYYIEFEGVNTIAYVYLNNVFVGKHEGGFSTFRFMVTDLIQKGENTIQVLVDNSPSDSVYPDTADFTFFGGIYRDVYMIEVANSRFDLDYYGGPGVAITPQVNADGSATINVKTYLTNAISGQNIDINIEFNGEIVVRDSVPADGKDCVLNIAKPMLWNGVLEPNLYDAHIALMNGNEMLDVRDIRFGIRTFSVDKDGFYLNGKPYDLHGVSRHQDRLNKGWAISKEDHAEDMALIKEVGATTIRLAHYQHAQYFYDLCDENGMVVWAEIPYISVHLMNGDANAISQMKELVIQNYNHASIMFWGLSNEITIGGESAEQLALHKELNTLVKELDPTRLTTMAAVSMCDTHCPLLDIPDIFSYNHYFGWYVGDVAQNATWLDEFRAEFPDRPLGLSEYGCEGILSWHSSTPKQGDYTEEYQSYYHENMLRIFSERPYLWSTHVWNMFDFAADARDEGGVKGRNNKGLVTYDRKTKKDSFYLYKAYWSKEPFIHICSKRYVKRCEKNTIIKVYTNQSKVDLYVGNKLVDTKTGMHIYEFEVPLSLLGTTITVRSGELVDSVKLRRVLRPCKAYTIRKPKATVNNWFEKDGVRYEFDFPEGKFSIRDKFNTIYAIPEGEQLLNNLVAEALKKIDPNAEPMKFLKSARKLVGGMTIERIAAFAGDKISTEMLYHVNEELNKIDKPSTK